MRELVNEFTAQDISMPDDARERIVLNWPNKDEATQEKPQAPSRQHTTVESPEHTQTLNDVSSDTNEIREQAEQSRDPEQGKNII